MRFRVGEPFENGHTEAGYIPVYDEPGWCRAMARTPKEAERLRAGLEDGTLHSTIISPLRSED